jgi:hypothetical protein
MRVGGAQEVVRTLVKYQTRTGCIPVVCTLEDGPLRERIEELGVKVEIINGKRRSILALPFFILDMIRIYRDLAAVASRHEIDIVQTHLFRVLDFLVLLLPVTTGVKSVIFTYHSVNFVLRREEMPGNYWTMIPKRKVQHFLYRLAARKVGRFVAVSGEVKKNMIKILGKEVEGKTTVGTRVEISHLRAAPLGAEIEVTSELVEVDGRRLRFRVEAYWNGEKIGEGFHERFIVDRDRFLSKIQKEVR